MKNRYLIIALVSSLLFNLYLMSERRKLRSQKIELTKKIKTDNVSVSQAAIKNTPKNETNKSIEKEADTPDAVNNPTLYTGLPTEEELADSQEKWRENITDFMISGLNLRDNDVDQYFEIKNARDRELSQFLTERVKSQGSFIYTLEDMVEENKINEKYLNQLKSLMGDQGYESYKAFRDLHNHQMIESQQMHSLIEL